ncbi:hypothetical protein ACSBR1_037775 [Camellia fascicularis]
MNDLNTMRMYDWTRLILTTMMGSIKEFHRTPRKVMGCVVTLMDWICEHSTILEPQTDNIFPKFLKWDIGKLLSKAQGVDLPGPVNFQVKVDRLRSFDYEHEVMGMDVMTWENVEANVIECNGGNEHFVDELKVDGGHTEAVTHGGKVEFECGDERKECSSWGWQQPDNSVEGNGIDALQGSTNGKGNQGVNDNKLNEVVSAIAALELQNKKMMKWSCHLRKKLLD